MAMIKPVLKKALQTKSPKAGTIGKVLASKARSKSVNKKSTKTGPIGRALASKAMIQPGKKKHPKAGPKMQKAIKEITGKYKKKKK